MTRKLAIVMTTTHPRITLKAAVVLSLLTGCALTGATLYLANIPPHAFTPLLIASMPVNAVQPAANARNNNHT